MNELKAILDTYDLARKQGESTVLATVVKVVGSAYRRPGARMLIAKDGTTAGTVSGGCLEADVTARALSMLQEGPSQLLVEYDTTREDEVIFGTGLGCAGSTFIFLEVVDPAHVLLQSRRSRTISYELPNGRQEVFFDYIEPPLALFVFGAGHDAQPLVNLAKELGWHVTVVDDRPAYITKQRFSLADSLICCRLDLAGEKLDLKPHSFAVVMTHSFPRDLKILPLLLASPVEYIGVLGPKLRTQRLIKELQEKEAIASDSLGRIHAPVGLDLGAETPAEIALAVLAEIQAVRARRSGAMLKDRAGPIHDPLTAESESNASDIDFGASTVSEITTCPGSV